MNLCHVTFVSTVLPVKNISVLKVYVHHCECFYCFYHWIIVTVFNWKVFVSYQYFKCWIFLALLSSPSSPHEKDISVFFCCGKYVKHTIKAVIYLKRASLLFSQ